jgi:5-methylcytosine-specific restriction protein A
MAKVTPAQVRACYNAALSVRSGAMRSTEAMCMVAKDTGMPEGNAGVTVNILRSLLDGKPYTFTLTSQQTHLFLTWVTQDFGADFGRAAAEKVLENVKDTAAPPINNGPQRPVQEVAAQFLANLAQPSLENLIAQQTAAADPMPRTTTVTTTAHLRNMDVVAEVVHRANGTCEACATPAPFLKRKDGSPYLEVHHKLRLADGGPDTVANTLALCPNCHRKAHHGIAQFPPRTRPNPLPQKAPKIHLKFRIFSSQISHGGGHVGLGQCGSGV